MKNNYHTVEVLIDYNNLKNCMNVRKLNDKQVK